MPVEKLLRGLVLYREFRYSEVIEMLKEENDERCMSLVQLAKKNLPRQENEENDDWKTHENKGKEAVQKGLKEEGEAHFVRALEIQPMVSTLLEYLQLGGAPTADYNIDIETSALIRGLGQPSKQTLRANGSLGLAQLAATHFQNGQRPETSLKFLKRKFQLGNTQDPSSLADLALCEFLTSDFDQALAHINHALNADNTSTQVWLAAAHFAILMGDLFLATSIFKIIISLDSNATSPIRSIANHNLDILLQHS
mmetsp:Transcript_4713/g.7105  ORF Transcript_4713/g.7105 Transcript_4713/m.7105 type:complete len:254 (+) Transcript_4713:2677-3438(+)